MGVLDIYGFEIFEVRYLVFFKKKSNATVIEVEQLEMKSHCMGNM